MNVNNLRVVLIAHDIPYPPNHGGRVDMWNRLLALSLRGVKVHLITWSDLPVTDQDLSTIKQYAEVTVLPRKKSLILALHPQYPTQVTSRSVSEDEYKRILANLIDFNTNIIFLDGFHGYLLATALAEDIKCNIVYRSHNVEHQYVQELIKVEKKLLRKAMLFFDVKKILYVEEHIRERSSAIYDISGLDSDYWRARSATSHMSKVIYPYLSPQEKIVEKELDIQNSHGFEVLYIGNLHTPNNVYGLKWFIEQVKPYLDDVKVTFVGSNPKKDILYLAARNGINVIPNPKNIKPFVESQTVLINPVWHGSGINIKMIEMLASGNPVVATSKGLHGVDRSLHKHVGIADEGRLFADSIRERLHSDKSLQQIKDVKNIHDWTKVDLLISDLLSMSKLK